jgi:hypothetical protein
MQVSRAMVFQSGLKTGGGAARMVHVTSSQRVRRGWCTWHHCGGCVDVKLKLDGSMLRDVSDPATIALPFSLY